MAKTHIEGETKQQRKARKALEKAQKSVESSQDLPQKSAEPVVVKQPNLPKAKRYVCCLKYGNKYSADYVNNLYNMVTRNLTVEHEFVCFTEDSRGIDPNIRIEPLPSLPVTGWWYKPMFFNPDLGLRGTLLFLDLDMVIFKNIDNLFTYKPDQFCIIRDFNRHVIKHYNKFNSSIFRLTTGQHAHVYKTFLTDPKNISKRYHGDQDWIRHCIKKDYEYWPEEWIQSYKWEMRGKPRFDAKPRGQRDFLTPGDPKILPETSIAVFHGDPNPHNCKDQWVVDNWQ